MCYDVPCINTQYSLLFISREANSCRNNILNVDTIKKNASMGVSCNIFKEPYLKYEISDLIDTIHISHS
jgi:hypothetical protein